MNIFSWSHYFQSIKPELIHSIFRFIYEVLDCFAILDLVYFRFKKIFLSILQICLFFVLINFFHSFNLLIYFIITSLLFKTDLNKLFLILYQSISISIARFLQVYFLITRLIFDSPLKLNKFFINIRKSEFKFVCFIQVKWKAFDFGFSIFKFQITFIWLLYSFFPFPQLSYPIIFHISLIFDSISDFCYFKPQVLNILRTIL